MKIKHTWGKITEIHEHDAYHPSRWPAFKKVDKTVRVGAIISTERLCKSSVLNDWFTGPFKVKSKRKPCYAFAIKFKLLSEKK